MLYFGWVVNGCLLLCFVKTRAQCILSNLYPGKESQAEFFDFATSEASGVLSSGSTRRTEPGM